MRGSSSWHSAVRLLAVVSKNLEYFHKNLSTPELERNQFYRCFQQLVEHSSHIQPIMETMKLKAHKFDFDKIPANGFRSLLSVTEACLDVLIQTSGAINSEIDDFLFRKTFHLSNLQEYTKVLGALRKMLDYAQTMMATSEQTGSVFPRDGSALIESWFDEIETLDQEVFYGKSLGFQYYSSIYNTLQTVALALAVCADTYRKSEERQPGSARLAKQLPSMFTTTRFIMKPHLRAKQIVHTTRNADINFCKQFWGLTEASYLQSGFNFMLPSIAVNKIIEIPPEVIDLHGRDGEEVFLKPPTQSKSVFTRFISDVNFDASDSKGEKPPLSSCLLFHCHGGGFISQSSKAHEVYLLKWAKNLKIPILSVDYALAPEYPYPKGLDEVVFAYAWALRNAGLLGWTGEKICLVGDSAGANLIVGASLKIACKGLKIADGILAAYGAFLVQYTPSPSRLLCLMDPILPIGILTRCLAAYAGIPEPTCVGQVQGADDKVKYENSGNDVICDTSLENDLSSITPNTDVTLTDHESSNPNGDNHAENSRDFSAQNYKTRDWFGKGSTLFSGKTKPGEAVTNRRTRADVNDTADKNNLGQFQANQKVQPLPRYNFASVSSEDPFLSPLLAEDSLLVTLPPVFLVACNLDPMLDDSISLARRLSKLKAPSDVHLDVIDKLPHGFLNFCLLSSEAAEAADLCMKRIRTILRMDDL